ncbi:dipeptidyl peptidase 3 [bacterium]|nr:dipeptidyl peptidase 3 [bacterium]
MRRLALAVLAVIIAAILFSCSKHTEHVADSIPGTTVDRIDNLAIVALSVPRFADLSAEERLACYYLNEAIKAGRTITYGQIHRRHNDIMPFLEEIALGLDYGAPQETVESYWRYVKRIWLNNGFYDLKTLEKIKPTFKAHDMTTIMFVALSNLGGRIGDVTTINYKKSWLRDSLFSPFAESQLIWRNSRGQLDYKSFPVPNFYQGLTIAEARDFKAEHPYNSLLLKDNDRNVEWVYRVGNEKIARGPYAEQLDKIIENLEKARPYLSRSQVSAVDLLSEHFITGDWDKFIAAQQILASENSPLEFITGFSDMRFDPLQTKGLWAGILGVTDHAAGKQFEDLHQAALTPIDFPGVASQQISIDLPVKTIELIDSYGPVAPRCPDYYVHSPGGGEPLQVFVFTNVIRSRVDAEQQWLGNWIRQTDSDNAVVEDLSEAFIQEAFFRVLFGNAALEAANPFRMQQSTVESAGIQMRHLTAELALLWRQLDTETRVSETGNPLNQQDYLSHVFRRMIISLIPSDTGFDLRQGSYRIMGHYLLENNLLQIDDSKGGVAFTMSDISAIRQALQDLAHLSEKLSNSTGAQRLTFLKQYCSALAALEPFNSADSMRPVNPVTEIAFMLPEVHADYNGMGGIEDVSLHYSAGFAQAMLALGGWPEEDYKDLSIPTGVEH